MQLPTSEDLAAINAAKTPDVNFDKPEKFALSMSSVAKVGDNSFEFFILFLCVCVITPRYGGVVSLYLCIISLHVILSICVCSFVSLRRCVVASLRRCVVASLRRCVVASLRRCVVASLRRCVFASLRLCVCNFCVFTSYLC